MKKFLIVIVVLALAGAAYGGLVVSRKGDDKNAGFKQVAVAKGTVLDKALATGEIVPQQEIQVKSQISGTIQRTYVEVGDRVAAGDPLFSISPDPTPLQLTEAERNVEMAQVSFAQAKTSYERAKSLFSSGVLSQGDLDTKQQAFDQARIQVDLEKERLELLREGKITKQQGGVDSVIRAPAAGTVLERLVNPGDPVVPLTTFQAGTPLMTLADMHDLVFKGTVDEIDVGKLREGLPARIKVGALPKAEVSGKLVRIAPKAKEQDGSTVFDVEISIVEAQGVTLRAGYSANADIIVREKKDVLVVPERLLIFEGEKTFVEVPGATAQAEPVKKEVQVGLSDGLNAEVTDGLKLGDKVVERPPKEIS